MDSRRAYEILRSESEVSRGIFEGIDELLKSTADALFDLYDAIEHGAIVLTGGNGGSAAMASHFTGELIGRFQRDRKPIPSVCLNADDSVVTCIANDYGYANTLVRAIESYRGVNKFVVLFSTSGKSDNIVRAVEYMSEMKIKGILLTSEECKIHSTTVTIIRVNAKRTCDIQLQHQFLMHCMCTAIDEGVAINE